MSDSDNYFSDSDNEHVEDVPPINNTEEESDDDGYDEETRRIIYNSLKNIKE